MLEEAQEEKPEHASQGKMDDRHEETPLHQLAQPGKKETANRGEHVSRAAGAG